MDSGTSTPQPGWVICLCAEWCGTCREWRAAFEAAQAAHPELRFAWVDIEDESDAMGEVDVETFPTLLVARGTRPLFLGPVLPSAPGFERLLASLLHGGDEQPSATVPAEAGPLLARLTGRVLAKP
ncbi:MULTISPECIES: thioredoxin family protein [Ramlibacter]|uniref:Thioredoxin family protein n=1 Tax=Ramlibacter aquaticus TaxID=2780094 RepID=A0ABR9SDW4_9BURK|nr:MULTISPECIES: thioredoxin family protein [Ramlibacter]MBE7940541.1 thioredoxin family protein [Ramlibacter aquaticus]